MQFSVFRSCAFLVICAWLVSVPVVLFADAKKAAPEAGVSVPATKNSVIDNSSAASTGDVTKSGDATKADTVAKSSDTGKKTVRTQLSASVRADVNAALALRDRDKVIAALVAAVSRQANPADKKAVLSVLADYEERSGLLSAAAKHYSEAAYTDSAARDDGCLLDAARCALSSGDIDQANGLVRAVLVSSFDDAVLLRARVYAVWIQLASGDRVAALSQLRAFSGNPLFSGYTPALLFSLWWADGDESAKKRLLDSYSGSPEAAVARGDMSLGANPFWFLMGRNEALVSTFADAGNAALAKDSLVVQQKNAPEADKPSESAKMPASAASSAPADSAPAVVPSSTVANSGTNGQPVIEASPASGKRWQQVGFFKNRENADELLGKLVKLGFSPIMRNERRPSGTVYFSVLVPEDASGAVGNRLKDAGFETFLLIE